MKQLKTKDIVVGETYYIDYYTMVRCVSLEKWEYGTDYNIGCLIVGETDETRILKIYASYDEVVRELTKERPIKVQKHPCIRVTEFEIGKVYYNRLDKDVPLRFVGFERHEYEPDYDVLTFERVQTSGNENYVLPGAMPLKMIEGKWVRLSEEKHYEHYLPRFVKKMVCRFRGTDLITKNLLD